MFICFVKISQLVKICKSFFLKKCKWLVTIRYIVKIEEQISRENAGSYLKIVNINNKHIHYLFSRKKVKRKPPFYIKREKKISLTKFVTRVIELLNPFTNLTCNYNVHLHLDHMVIFRQKSLILAHPYSIWAKYFQKSH